MLNKNFHGPKLFQKKELIESNAHQKRTKSWVLWSESPAPGPDKEGNVSNVLGSTGFLIHLMVGGGRNVSCLKESTLATDKRREEREVGLVLG